MKKSIVRELTETALFASLMCVGAFIYIPLFVPITLQTLVLFAALFILGGRRGSIVTLVYILLGALGLPVFSGFSGGVVRLLDAGGGYITGMLLGSLTYWLCEKFLPEIKYKKILSAIAALLVIYLFGTLWFTFTYANGGKSFLFVLASCVLPFIVPDAIKIYLAYFISKKIPRS